MGRFDREDTEGLPASLGSATEELRASVERQVREIVESAEQRASAIEDSALERAAQVERESQDSAKELFHTSVERSDRMLEAIDALEREIGAVIGLLREEAERLASELRAGKVSHDVQPAFNELVAEQADEEPASAETFSEPEFEDEEAPIGVNGGSPEVRDMIHQQISNLRETGKPREDAQRFLLRFKHGESYLNMLDEIYGPDEEAEEPTPSASRRRRLRRRRAKEQREEDG